MSDPTRPNQNQADVQNLLKGLIDLFNKVESPDQGDEQLRNQMAGLAVDLLVVRSEAIEARITIIAAVLAVINPGLSWERYLSSAESTYQNAVVGLEGPRRLRRVVGNAAVGAMAKDSADYSILHEKGPEAQKGADDPEVQRAVSDFIRKVVPGETKAEKVARFEQWKITLPTFISEWLLEPTLRIMLTKSFRSWWKRIVAKKRAASGKRPKKR